MSYRVDVADFLEIINYNGFSATGPVTDCTAGAYLANSNVAVNEETVRDNLSIVTANYFINNDLILDCKEKDPFLELHFNLSKSAIPYKNTFTLSGEVPSMNGNLICVMPDDETSEISFAEKKEYRTFDIHLPLKLLNRYGGENKLLDLFLKQVSQNKSAALTDNSIKINSKILCAIQDIHHCKYEGLTRKIYLESKIYEILAFCFEEHKTNNNIKLSDRDIECIHFAAQIIKDHINNPVTIEELAKRIGINQTKLKTGFKSIFGTTVFGYLQQLRMNRAKQLLFDSDLSIEEISQLCGYINSSNFSAAFKKCCGVPPSAFRNS